MEEVQYLKKKNENKELLLLYRKLQELEESCWTKLLRFEKSNYFLQFQEKYSAPSIINIRLDDIIYLLLLAAQEMIFGLLPINSLNPLTTTYRQSLVLYFLTSFVVLISPHWFRWMTLLLFCIGYPVLIFLTFQGYITMMPIDPSTQIFDYMGYLSLVPIFVFLILIYPIKEYIRNAAGSLYSYIYALSLTLIIYLWPIYSFITELSNTGSISTNFITQNQPLIISFICLISTGFYFFTHHSLFEAKIEKVQQLLLQQFTKGELTKVMEQTEQQHLEQTTCLYSNFNIYVRSMSFIIYAITIGSEIYLYLMLVSDSSKMAVVGSIMGYIIGFLLIGSLLIYIPVSKEVMIPVVTILSISSAASSLLYYNSSTNLYNYIFISLSAPFIVVFWSIIKSVSPKKPIFRINSIICLYLAVYLPVMALVLHSFELFTKDSIIVSILNYSFYSTIGLSLLILLILFIVWEVLKRKGQTSKEEDVDKVLVDYNYNQEGDPAYQHYEVSQKYRVGYLANLDLRQIGYLTGMCFFLFCQMLSIHAVNQLNTIFASTVFYSSIINEVIYAQFSIIFLFYCYTHVFLVNPQDSIAKYGFLIIFILLAAGCLASGYLLSFGSTTFKIIGGFNLLMVLISFALDSIKSSAQKIFGFVSSIIVISLWIFIIIPYVELIPFASLYVDQSKFGTYIYGCILGSIVLLIFLVGILTLVFNKLIDKYEEEKKFKFMTEDVRTLLEEEGVETGDEELNILYESFLYRDKKYVFFLKRGFPVNILQDPDSKITKLVTSEDYSLQRIPTKKDVAEQLAKERSCIWKVLTFCCGEDDEQINQKLKKAKKIMDKQQLQSLLPKNLISGLMKPDQQVAPIKKKQKKWINPAKVFSSKSLLLRGLHEGPRYLGDEYILLKTSKRAQLAIQLWHNIFDFIANIDEGEPLIISNDFKSFIEVASIDIPLSDIDKLFYDYASKKWKQFNGMDLLNFSLAVEYIAEKLYPDIKGEERKFFLLIDKAYYNLCLYEEFNNFMVQKKTTDRISKIQLKKSPFNSSFQKYLQFKKTVKREEEKLIERVKKHDDNKLLEPQVIKTYSREIDEEQKPKQKQKSCKKKLYESVKACETCCKKQVSKDQIERKLFVKPWKLLSVDAVKILERKQNEWGSTAETQDHPFRLISNNILMAIFKALDLYTYVNISLTNPKIGWISGLSSGSNLYFSYSLQTYFAAGVVGISVPLGIRGIMLIFEDRLGLTQNRLPASFPHPMFFFTFIYKLLILSLFNIITQTFLDTFNCNWTATSPPYTLYDDTTVECFSDSHSRFVIMALIGLIAYYPLSAYAMPNFQFAEKSLDLKYRSSYLILYFQVNFILLAAKVLLSGVINDYSIQIIYNSINIFALTILAISVLSLKPCFINWFNYVEFFVIFIGIVVNVMGFVLFITEQWVICVVVVSSVSGLSLLILIIFIRKRFFSKQIAEVQEEDQDNVKQLEMMWMAKQKRQKTILNSQARNIDNKPANKFQAVVNLDHGSEDDTSQDIK